MAGLLAYFILIVFFRIALLISNRLVEIFRRSLSPIKLFLLRAGVFVIVFILYSFLIALFYDSGWMRASSQSDGKKIESDWMNIQGMWKEDYFIRQNEYVIYIVCEEIKYYNMDTKNVFPIPLAEGKGVFYLEKYLI